MQKDDQRNRLVAVGGEDVWRFAVSGAVRDIQIAAIIVPDTRAVLGSTIEVRLMVRNRPAIVVGGIALQLAYPFRIVHISVIAIVSCIGHGIAPFLLLAP